MWSMSTWHFSQASAGADEVLFEEGIGAPSMAEDLMGAIMPAATSMRAQPSSGAAAAAAVALACVIGSSQAMGRVRRAIELVARSRCIVLITGETGTGKEVVARAIHAMSSAASAPFEAVNVAGLSPALADSRLFGHERGAFTGAHDRHRGAFELARDGTVFLDEVGDVSLDVQLKLLRVLQEREFRRLGSERDQPLRARILAGTNADLQQRVAEGQFRADLLERPERL
jgi:transcriptional regulator with GAF, ATPase, and Fis domain